MYTVFPIANKHVVDTICNVYLTVIRITILYNQQLLIKSDRIETIPISQSTYPATHSDPYFHLTGSLERNPHPRM